MSDDYDFLLKLLLVGDTAVGKSSLLLRFTDGTFDTDLQSTIGVDFKVKQMRVAGKAVKATIWDTAGQERFRTLTSSYYRGAHGIILVYDVTRPETFQHLAQWLAEIEMYSPGGGKNVIKLLVGNKSDLAQDRAVQRAEGEAWAREGGMLFLESSAKNADNVKAVFEEVVQRVLESPALLANAQPTASRQGVVLRNAAKPEVPAKAAGGGDGCC